MKNKNSKVLAVKLTTLAKYLKKYKKIVDKPEIDIAYQEVIKAIKKIREDNTKHAIHTPKKKIANPKDKEVSIIEKIVEADLTPDIFESKLVVGKANALTIDGREKKGAFAKEGNDGITKEVELDLQNGELGIGKAKNIEKKKKEGEEEVIVTENQPPEKVKIENKSITKLKLDLKNAGIELEKTREISITVNPGELRVGLFKVEPSFDIKAALSIGGAISKDEAKLKASLAISANLGLDLFLDLKLVELGGKVKLKFNGGVSGHVSLNTKGKGVLKLNASPQKLTLGLSLFIRLGDTAMDIANVISELLGGKGFQSSDKHKYAWEIPLGKDIPLAEFTIPEEEIPFDVLATNGIQSKSDFPALIKKEIDQIKKGPIGTVIDVIEFVSDAIEFIGDVIGSIGDFFKGIWNGLVKAFKNLWSAITESEEERLEKYLKEKGQANYETIFAKAMANMKKKPKHLEKLGKIPKGNIIERYMYIFGVVWPEVQKDTFVKSSMQALKDGDYELLEKNALIARSAFFVMQHNIDGNLIGDAFVAGTNLKVALDIRRMKDFFELIKDTSNEKRDALLRSFGYDPSVFKKGIGATVRVSLLYNGAEVSHESLVVESFVTFNAKMNNAYIFNVSIPNNPDLASTDVGGAWSVQWKIDFEGEIMDIKDDPVNIKVTHQQLNDVLLSEEDMMMETQALPEMLKPKLFMNKKYRVKDGNGRIAYTQGAKIRISQPLNLKGLYIEQGEALDMVAYSVLTYNKKAVYNSKTVPYKITQDHIDVEQEFETKMNIFIPKNDNLADTCRGGEWRIFTYVEITERGKIKNSKSIRVFNNNKKFTDVEVSKSYEDADVLDKLDKKIGIEHKEQKTISPNISRDENGDALESHPDLNDE